MESKLLVRVVVAPSAAGTIKAALAERLGIERDLAQVVPVHLENLEGRKGLGEVEPLVAVLATLIAGGTLYKVLKDVIIEFLHSKVVSLKLTNEKTGVTIDFVGQPERIDKLLDQLLPDRARGKSSEEK